MIMSGMGREGETRSAALENLRLMLFPQLSPEEGRRRIDVALEGASDSERAKRIEELASNPGLLDELFRRLLPEGENGLR
jgi:hypothetical protein